MRRSASSGSVASNSKTSSTTSKNKSRLVSPITTAKADTPTPRTPKTPRTPPEKKPILRPVKMKYPTEPAPPEGFFSRLISVISSQTATALPPEKKPVRVRLINSWNDCNTEKINIIVCNFLYEKDPSFWSEMEKATGVKREKFFYGIAGVFLFFILCFRPLNALFIFAGVIIPLISSLIAMNDNEIEHIKIWMKYWIIFATLLTLEYLAKRATGVDDMDFIKLVIVTITLAPYFNLTSIVYDFINAPFNEVRDRFERQNYHVVM